MSSPPVPQAATVGNKDSFRLMVLYPAINEAVTDIGNGNWYGAFHRTRALYSLAEPVPKDITEQANAVLEAEGHEQVTEYQIQDAFNLLLKFLQGRDLTYPLQVETAMTQEAWNYTWDQVGKKRDREIAAHRARAAATS